MAIQVNIFEAGSVPTAQELVTLINELNTTLDESVTLTGEQSITGVKTFLGSKLLKFKQSVSADKLGFTLYDYQSKEVGNFEYDNKNNFRLLALGNYVSAANQEVECNIGFKIYNKLQSAAYRLLCPLAGNAKTSVPSLSETYTNFYIPLVFTNGAVSVTADNGGKVDLSTLIGSGSGDVSGLATVATTGDYNDLLNLPTLFSGNYNDLTNKPALFSGDYADLTNKPTIPTNLSDLSDDSTHRVVTDIEKTTWNNKSDFSGSYNDLTDKPTIPNAQVNSDWNSSSGVSQILNKPNLATVATSGSYNDLSDKPTIPTVPTISTNITSDATSDTKTASPKAVKDFVEGKGYLTQHQDISGKADQTDLEALEDRVEALEQGDSGSTDEDKCVKLVKDPANYLKANVGDIIKYTGTTTSDFTHGHDYECTKKGNTAYSVSSGDYVLDVAESATNEDFIAAMANEVKPFKYSERANWGGYREYCDATNSDIILGSLNKTKGNLVVGDVLVSYPLATPISVITAVSGSTVTAKLISTGVEYEAVYSGTRFPEGNYSTFIFTNPEDVKVVIEDETFLLTETSEPYPPSIDIPCSNVQVYIIGKGSYSGTGTNITITKYYQSVDIAATSSEWVEAKPCDCSDGGGTTQYSYLKLIPDLDAYADATVGEIVKYTGQTNNKYTRGWDYEFMGNGEQITIPAGNTIITHLLYPEDSSLTDGKIAWNNYVSTTQTKFYQQESKTVNYGYTNEWSANWSFDSEIGELVYATKTINDTTSVKIVTPITAVTSNSVSFEYEGETITVQLQRTNVFVKFINTEGRTEYYRDTVLSKRDNTNSALTLLDMTNRKVRNGWVNITKLSSSTTITIGYSESPWQPIIHPTAPVSSGD